MARQLRSFNRLPADASAEQVFARRWLMEHMPFGGQNTTEHAALLLAGTCAVVAGNQLSRSLNTAWQEESERQRRSAIDREYAVAAAMEKLEKRRKMNASHRRESSHQRKLLPPGFVFLKEKQHGLEEVGIDPPGSNSNSDTEKELEEAAAVGGDDAEAAQEKLDELGVKFVPTTKAKEMHGAGLKPRVPIADASRTNKSRGGSAKKKAAMKRKRDKITTSSDTESEKDEESNSDTEEKTTSAKKQASGSQRESPALKKQIDDLYNKTLEKINKTGSRVANPMQAPASLKALRDACKDEIENPREKGFAGSVLAPPLPPFYNKFLNHINWK